MKIYWLASLSDFMGGKFKFTSDEFSNFTPWDLITLNFRLPAREIQSKNAKLKNGFRLLLAKDFPTTLRTRSAVASFYASSWTSFILELFRKLRLRAEIIRWWTIFHSSIELQYFMACLKSTYSVPMTCGSKRTCSQSLKRFLLSDVLYECFKRFLFKFQHLFSFNFSAIDIQSSKDLI